MITVGLDFGTHQTKVCIENKDGVELSYSFMKFKDAYHRECYTLPSIIGIGKDKLLSYGYLPPRFDGQVIKYFKQSAFRTTNRRMEQVDALFYSVWYLANILFDLEDEFGHEFTIQMGAPTDSMHLNETKQIATIIIASAYNLVENVFNYQKEKFLSTNENELIWITEIIPYSEKIKWDSGLLVFPEAYACLKPLISQNKLTTGMNLMIDIGGGTTDVSFFTIESKDPKNLSCKEYIPQVYDYTSINKGLNYLTRSEEKINNSVDSNVKDVSEIDMLRFNVLTQEITKVCNRIKKQLRDEYEKQTSLKLERLFDAFKNRPLIYCGGGSTFAVLRISYDGFKDKKLISLQEWDIKSIKDIDDIIKNNLCPILSTAYGLAISTENDDIVKKPLKDIFEKMRGAEEESTNQSGNKGAFGSAYGGFSYSDDWDAWK